MEAREWLRKNNYIDIADLIDEIMDEWRIADNHTRRNWWDKLAGRRNGKPCSVAGRELPILRAAQIRQGLPITDNALCHNENEIVPTKTSTGRWKNNKT